MKYRQESVQKNMIEVDEKPRERAVLVGVIRPPIARWEVEEHLDELAFLADTAGAQVVKTVIQERKQIDPTYFVGRGKTQQLAALLETVEADLVIFDDDLSPAQTRNLEKAFNRKVIDRSGLILDIFARRARTREARTQVELAQLRYLLPRLTRQWTHLSRQVGGIGTRGPGETQLEVDRRLIRNRISVLESDLKNIEKQRTLRRQHRTEVFKAALVGYTNVGKSTLMNALTGAGVFVEDRLFATLDATVRALHLSPHEPVLLIDTVGFIRKLPHHLIASFKSTLEEAREADLLLHVIDISHPHFEEQLHTVQSVLQELGLNSKPIVHVFNKIDRLENSALIQAMQVKYSPAVFISAARGIFLQDLLKMLAAFLHSDEEEAHFTLEAGEGAAIARIYQLTEVLEKQFEDHRVHFHVRASRAKLARLRAYLRQEGKSIANATV